MLERWIYILDTSNDECYPHISRGELLLRGDGRVFQRVHLSGSHEFEPWGDAPRAPGARPYTVGDVERIFDTWQTDYSITRMEQ